MEDRSLELSELKVRDTSPDPGPSAGCLQGSGRIRGLMVAAAVCGALGCLLNVAGLVSSEWLLMAEPEARVGLIFLCSTEECVSFAAEGTVAATKVFCLVCVFCGGSASLGCLVYLYRLVRRNKNHKALVLSTVLLYCMAVSMAVVATVLFAVKGTDEATTIFKRSVSLGYSFGLAAASGGVYVLAGVVNLVYHQLLPTL